MHKPSLTTLVYKRLFPNPRPSDPPSFATHISRNLVPEVRIETATFYGALDCAEAQYPGLDYSHPPHRLRLGRFQWHRRLFRAFDELRLTEQEISSICHWEGTKWARERYEKDNGVKVRDTTGEDIPFQNPPPRPVAILHASYPTSHAHPIPGDLTDDTGDDELEDVAEEDSDEEGEVYGNASEGELESVGLALNRRLLAATGSLDHGHPSPMDPEFEQWLREASERGSFDTVAGRAYPMAPNTDAICPTPIVDPVDIVASYASQRSPTSTSRLEQLGSPASPGMPLDSILPSNAEAVHRQTETAR